MIVTLALIAFAGLAGYIVYCMHTAPTIDDNDDDYPNWI